MNDGIDFQPIQQAAPPAASGNDGIDFQPIVPAAPSAPVQTAPEGSVEPQGSSIPGMATAALAGAGNVGAAIGQGAYDFGSYIDKKLGLITPAEAALGEAKVRDFFNQGRAFPEGNQNDPFNRAAAENPGTFDAARIGLGTGIALASASPEAPAAMSPVAALATRTGANAVSGGIAADGHQGLGMGLGAAGGLAGEAGAAGLSKAASTLNDAYQGIKNWIQPVKAAVTDSKDLNRSLLESETQRTVAVQQQSNNNWKPIDAIPGTINPTPIINKAQDIISNNADMLEKPQINVLAGIQQQASKMNTMQDARLLKQELSKNYTMFSGKGIPADVRQSYMDLKSQVDDAIKLKANDAGLGDAYKNANQFHQANVVPLHADGAMDRAKALGQQLQTEEFNKANPGQAGTQSPEYTSALDNILPKNVTPAQLQQKMGQFDANGKSLVEKAFINRAFKNVNFDDAMSNNFTGQIASLNKTINQFGDQLSPQGIKTMQGLKQVLTQAKDAKSTLNANMSTYAAHRLGSVGGQMVAGAALGGGASHEEGGDWKTNAASGAVGAIALPLVVHGLGQLLNSTTGHYIIGKLSNPATARQFIKAATNTPQSLLNDNQGQ